MESLPEVQALPRPTGERYVLVPVRAYSAITEALTDLAGPAAAGPLYYLGKKIGMGLIAELQARLGGRRDRRMVLEEYTRLLADLGFGRVEVLELDYRHALLKMVNPPSLSAPRPTALRSACHIERGMLVAALDAVTGLHHVAREVEEGYEPEPYCVVDVVHR